MNPPADGASWGRLPAPEPGPEAAVDTRRARIALVLLNVALLAAIVWLAQHAVRHVSSVEVPPGPLPTQLAVEGAPAGPASDPSGAVGAALDRPLPPPALAIDDRPPPVVKVPPLGDRFRLLVVFENREDPARSTAIVAARSGEQRTLACGDTLEGRTVVGVAVFGEGDERRAVLVLERDGEREVLRTERPAP
jgi:hypothetical protein